MMKMRTKGLLGLVTALAIGMCMSGCGNKDAESTEESTEEAAVEIVIETEEEIAEVTWAENTNILTGVADLTEEAIGMRPVAVVVSNVQAAMPQYGVSDADIIIEMLVEGGLTRFVALYGDYTQVPDICSVRSSRDYFPSLTEGFDAIYIHWGMDESVKDHYIEMDLDVFNGTYSDGGIFDRDDARLDSGYDLEHTGMVYGGEDLVAAIEAADMRIELQEDMTDLMFAFTPEELVVLPEGDECTYVKIEFGAATSEFNYDEEENVYYKLFNGDDQVDGVTGEQLSFTNVFLLEATITDRTDSPTRVAIDVYGVSDQVGYYVSNGVVQEIRWSKADEYSELMFYDLDGEELVINSGKSYIGFNYADKTTFE